MFKVIKKINQTYNKDQFFSSLYIPLFCFSTPLFCIYLKEESSRFGDDDYSDDYAGYHCHTEDKYEFKYIFLKVA